MLFNKYKIYIILTIVIYSTIAISALWLNHAHADSSQHSSPSNKLSDQHLDFLVGRGFFKKLWVSSPATTKASDGLGPLYNARSCFMCHINAGRGQVPENDKSAVSLFMRLSIPASTPEEEAQLTEHKRNVVAEPNYGTQFQNVAVKGLPAEGKLGIKYTDKLISLSGGESVVLHQPSYQLSDLNYGDLHPQTMLSPRLAPALFGVGLLNQISETAILEYSDPDDKDADGISGKANQVWSREFNKVMIGRFGHKAGIATLDEQNQSAFAGDIGLSTPLFPDAWGDCTMQQSDCRQAPHGDDPQYDNLEAPKKVTNSVLFYVSNIPATPQRHSNKEDVISGKATFNLIGCSNCHRESYKLDEKNISPYSDLLLHDMGDALADNRPEGQANGKEWRTTPLWGVGLTEKVNGHDYYLHDGRARTLQEAILWHGGEAKKSRDAYQGLNKEARQTLLTFLESL